MGLHNSERNCWLPTLSLWLVTLQPEKKKKILTLEKFFFFFYLADVDQSPSRKSLHNGKWSRQPLL